MSTWDGFPQNPERGSGWRTMETAPKDARTILLRFSARGFGFPQIVAGNFAHGGGEEQPPFGPGWFRPALNPDGSVAYFAEIGAEPDAWMPLPEGPCLTPADHVASVAAAAEAMREEAAQVLRKKAADYHTEHGSYDPSTGVTEYPGNGEDWMVDWEETADEIEAIPIPSADALARRDAEIADRVVLDVAELPDRTSPDGQPEMMLVTSEELHGIVLSAIRARAGGEEGDAPCMRCGGGECQQCEGNPA